MGRQRGTGLLVYLYRDGNSRRQALGYPCDEFDQAGTQALARESALVSNVQDRSQRRLQQLASGRYKPESFASLIASVRRVRSAIRDAKDSGLYRPEASC